MSNQSRWAVMVIEKHLSIKVLGLDQKINFNFRDGMAGYMPIFETEKAAKEHAKSLIRVYGNDVQILELKI